MYYTKGCAKRINSPTIGIDSEVDVACIMLRFDHLFDIRLRGVGVVQEQFMGGICQDLNSILGVYNRYESTLKPPEAGCNHGDEQDQQKHYRLQCSHPMA